MKESGRSRPGGAPLAVCVNDCKIDDDRQGAGLARVCFSLDCAFAELRWGNGEAAAGRSSAPPIAPLHQLLSERWRR